jgi:hypothetical protein
VEEWALNFPPGFRAFSEGARDGYINGREV